MSQRPAFCLPPVGKRILKTLVSCLAVCLVYEYVLGGRNPCFACIGAVYGLGSQFQEGFRHGFNRFVGTLLGGLLTIPFYWLYYNRPLGLPANLYLILGLFLVIYCNRALGANNAIQPGVVVYFVVMFTQPAEGYLSYTIARIIDTGVGVLFSLLLTVLRPSKIDQQKGICWREAFHAWHGSNQRPAAERYPLEEGLSDIQSA
jgi:uncharacterized membrane protein YgaE (UPF0421/DUF939 family)